jgi:hypothetical protein
VFEKDIVEEEADCLRLLIGVHACSPFVSPFGRVRRSSSLTSIVNLRSPRRVRSRWALIRSAGVAMVRLPLSGDSARKPFPRREWARLPSAGAARDDGGCRRLLVFVWFVACQTVLS